MRQLKRHPNAPMPCNGGSKAHYATAGNSPFGFRQSGCLMLHIAKSHNVSGIVAYCMPLFNELIVVAFVTTEFIYSTLV